MFQKRYWIAAILLTWSLAGAQTGLKPRELLELLKKAPSTAGVQVGLIVDPQEGTSTQPYAELVTLGKGSWTAFDVLEKAKVNKVYHPQYKEPPMVMVLSLMGKHPDRPPDGLPRSWAFFVLSADQKRWILSDKGIAQKPVEDGSVIGFSRTAWDGMKAKDEPRLR